MRTFTAWPGDAYTSLSHKCLGISYCETKRLA
jgi:hypothetical protein